MMGKITIDLVALACMSTCGWAAEDVGIWKRVWLVTKVN